MNLVKRGWYSTTRKPKKNLLLATMLCFISLLLIVATGIGSGQREVQAEIRNQLGGHFRLERNWETLDEGQWGPDSEWVEFGIPGGGGTVLPHPAYEYQMGLVRADLDRISELDGIGDVNILAQPRRFFPMDFTNDRTYVGEERPDPLLHDKVWLQGVLNGSMLDEIRHGFIDLEAGRFIRPADNENGDTSFMISSNLAEANGLSVGDSLTLDWEDERWDAELDHFGVDRLENRELTGTIVGIFTVSRSLSPNMNSTSLENTIFSNLDAFETVMAGDVGPGHFYTDASFTIDNVDRSEQVLADLENLDLDWVRYIVVTPDDLLAQLSESFDGLQNISHFMFIGVLIAGFTILWLIFTLWIKNRRHETGILLAIGTEKRYILAQFILEGTFIAVIAIGFAFALFPAISRMVNIEGLHSFVENQLSPDEIDDPNMFYIPVDTVDGLMSDDFHQDATSGLRLHVRDVVVVTFGILGMLVVSITVAMIPTMRLKPKEILTRMN